MSCKKALLELLPITTHLVNLKNQKKYDLEAKNTDNYQVEEIKQKEYDISVCVFFRDPNLPEWILARWWWNDEWLWTPDWIFPM